MKIIFSHILTLRFMSNISSGGHLWQLDGGQLREEPGSLAGADVCDGGGDDVGDVDGDVNGDGAGDIDSDGDVVSDVGGTPIPSTLLCNISFLSGW